jgi:uncharacterized protein
MGVRGSSRGPFSPWRSSAGFFLLMMLLILLTILWRGIEVPTEWFWFQEVGYETIFTITLLAQMKVAAYLGVGFFLLFFGNLFLANRFSSRRYWLLG